MPFSLAEPLCYYLIAVNFAAFAAFGLDKARAEAGAWRISEGTLLGLALAGGTLGAYAGRRAFLHKTRKVSFTRRLSEVVGVQGAAAGLLVLAVAGWAPQLSAPLLGADEVVPPEVATLLDGGTDGDVEDLTPSGDREHPVRLAASGMGGRLVGCDAVRAAGRAPLTRADPDYHPAMDRDGDGIACEPVKNGAAD